MNQQNSIFRTFAILEQAKELKVLLDENGIDSILGDNVPPVDVTFSGSTINNLIEVRIKQSDFERAEQILEKSAENILDEVNQDYYLFDFTDEELYEILLKSDEWNSYDYTLAKKLLAQRGKPIDNDMFNSLKKERIKQLAKPEENQKAWIFCGYIFAILGGFLGLIIGYFLWTAEKTLPDGNKVYSYSEKDRKRGKTIFFISVIIFPTALFFRAFGPFA